MLLEISTPSIIAETTHIQGTVLFSSSAHVFGAVEGEIIQNSVERLFFGPHSWVFGRVSSRGPVIIGGRIDGDVTSETKITLLPTANVQGAIQAPHVEIQSGAILEGNLTTTHKRKLPLKLEYSSLPNAA